MTVTHAETHEHEHEHGSAMAEEVPYYEQTIKEIINGDIYQCMICTVEMDPYCKMYNCEHCFRVFDFECIKQWAEKSIKRNRETTADSGFWKCPNCMHPFKKIPSRNTCWCGKTLNPEPNQLYPNSCGQTCGSKKNGACKEHGCLDSCHLGPHEKCPLLIDVYCDCKLTSRKEMCASVLARKMTKQNKSSSDYSCDTTCGLLMPCGVHTCNRKCHSGVCGECKEDIVSDNIRCYCGLESKKNKMKCNDIAVRGESVDLSQDPARSKWIGAFECSNIRKIHYDCNQHEYEVDCDVVDSREFVAQQCPLSPKLLTTCPCGKTEITSQQRTACVDPVPTCESICGKFLLKNDARYRCPYKCHNGPCMDINKFIETKTCACEYTKFLVPYALKEPPKCHIQCDMLMSCKKHRCKEICCSGKPSALKRNTGRKTFFNSHIKIDESEIEPMHVCLKTCNQLLNCKIHRCTKRCHLGKCSPCIDSDSNDLVCPCGKTVILAPVRCGTVLPKCMYNCSRVGSSYETCGHRINPHPCHEGDCPKCTVSVLKECKCHRKTPVRTLCYINDVSCGQLCNQGLEKCVHKCLKKCHLESESCTENCTQVCNSLRVDCGHKCLLKCHGLVDCVAASAESYKCENIVTVECGCSRIKQNIKCWEQWGFDIINCDDDCKHFQKLLNFRKALNLSDEPAESGLIIDVEDNDRLKITVDTTYDDLKLPYQEEVLLAYGKNKAWASQIESFLKSFVENGGIISHHFKPMPTSQRSFIRMLSNAYLLYSESQDKEPKRSVFVKKNIENGNIISVKPSMSLLVAQGIYWKFKDHVKELKIKHYKESRAPTVLSDGFMETSSSSKTVTKYDCFIVDGKCSAMEVQEIMDQFLKFTLIGDIDIEQPDVLANTLVIKPVNTVTGSMEKDMATILPMISTSLENKYGSNVACKLGKANEPFVDVPVAASAAGDDVMLSSVTDYTETPEEDSSESPEEENNETPVEDNNEMQETYISTE